MTRNTHHRDVDHHGTDSDLDSVLSDDLPSPVSTATGQTIRQALLDIISNLGSGGGDDVQMLPDDDANFTATIGAWTASGGTMVRDTGSEKLTGQAADGKFTAAAPGDHTDLAIAGTFKSGVPYTFIVIARDGSGGALMTATFGKIGTDSVVFSSFGIFSDRGTAYAITWVPSADRTGVSFRWANGGTGIVYILAARLYQADHVPIVRINSNGNIFIPYYADAGGYSASQQGVGPSPTQGFFWQGNQLRMGVTAYGAAGFSMSDGDSGGESEFDFWAEHTPGDFATSGFNIEVGVDYVGLYISEKDAGTIQIYADSSGGYDIELKDRGAGFWKMVTADGLGVAIPSMGIIPAYASAPHVGTETEGESYYDLTDHEPKTWNGTTWVAAGGGGAPTTVDYLVGTASGGLSAEIVVGTSPGGELGGTWASPTVDSTHSGSTHAGAAAAAVSTHEGLADPHPGYLTPAEGAAAYDAIGAATSEVGAHTGDTSAAHAASAVSVTPAGDIASTDVQAALQELDTEKSATSHTHAYLSAAKVGARVALGA